MYSSYSVPISVKGIAFEGGKVWLRLNQRNEWELPGGKMDAGEQPKETCAREMREELGFTVEVEDIVQAYLHTIDSSADEKDGVLVVSYLCRIKDKDGGFELVSEGGKAQFQAFGMDEIDDLKMPQFYKEAIAKAWGSR